MQKQSKFLKRMAETISDTEGKIEQLGEVLEALTDNRLTVSGLTNRLVGSNMTHRLFGNRRIREKLIPFVIELTRAEIAEVQSELNAMTDPLAIAMKLKEMQEKENA